MVEEKRVRTAKGLCFNCDEAYTPGHRCKGRLFRMDTDQGCLIDVCEESPDLESVGSWKALPRLAYRH